jgi:hypothetical protein
LLQYNEDRYTTEKYIDKIGISIENICASSSGTIKKQNELKDGLTIVTFLEKEYSNKIQNIIDVIDNLGYNFIPTKKLHCTLLGLKLSDISDNLSWNKYYENLSIEAVEEFFEIQQPPINFNLYFECIRPGTLYSLNQNPIPNASDGTVILYGNYNDNGNKDFVDCRVKLVKALKNKLPDMFDEKFDFPFPTIWSTLGYFKHSDFSCNKDKNFETIFNKFSKLKKELANVEVNELRMIKYRKRSLEDAQLLLKIPK